MFDVIWMYYVIFQVDTNDMKMYLYRLKLFKNSDEQFVVLNDN